jgi:transcriptional regulator with GAF, ATPase, and Fis domain
MEVDSFTLYRQKRQRERIQNVVTQSSAVVSIKLDALKKLAQALLLEVSSLEQKQENLGPGDLNLIDEVRGFEADLIRCALVKTGGHQALAARLLNIKPTTLHEKMKRYGIQQFESREIDTGPVQKAGEFGEVISQEPQ